MIWVGRPHRPCSIGGGFQPLFPIPRSDPNKLLGTRERVLARYTHPRIFVESPTRIKESPTSKATLVALLARVERCVEFARGEEDEEEVAADPMAPLLFDGERLRRLGDVAELY